MKELTTNMVNPTITENSQGQTNFINYALQILSLYQDSARATKLGSHSSVIW